MGQNIRALMCASALLFTAGTAFGALGNQEQKCVNKINKGASKVHAAQGKLNSGCIKDAVSEKIPNADTCIAADAKGKVSGKQGKLIDDDTKNCSSAPSFGYVGGAFAGTTAAQAELDLIHDIYGNPVQPNLFLCDTNPAECLCQRQVNGRINKLFRAMSKIYLKCKNPALAIGKDPFTNGAADATELAQCISNGSIGLSVQADTKGKVSDGRQQLEDTAGQFCFTNVSDEFSAGACAGSADAATLANCILDQVQCRFCRMYKAVDALGGAINCQTWSGLGSCAP